MAKECPTHGVAAVASAEVHVAVILDESGSMESCRDKTIQGYNEYLHGLRQSGVPYLVTLTKFDASAGDPTCRIAYRNKAISDAPTLSRDTYTPRGSTPLYDAIGETIKTVDKEANGHPVLVIILTDGEENSSHEYTAESVKDLIAAREKNGNWTFVYLGANQDAWAVGQKFGMQAGNVANYATAAMPAVMKNMARASSAYGMRASYSASLGQQYATNCFFADANVNQDSLNSDPVAQALGSMGGAARAASQTAQQRRKQAKKAAKARWSK